MPYCSVKTLADREFDILSAFYDETGKVPISAGRDLVNGELSHAT